MDMPQVQFIRPKTSYEDVLAMQEAAVAEVVAGTGPERLFFVEHAPVYTVGSSGHMRDILRQDIPVVQTGRGGQVTYHGPGQRVIYPVLDLRERGRDVRAHINNLQYWVLAVLRELGVRGHLSDDVGVWVNTPDGTAKIAAVGVRVRQWVSFHGLALNVAPDLGHFDGIVPCGIRDKGVTSLAELGLEIGLDEVDKIFLRTFGEVFGEGLSV